MAGILPPPHQDPIPVPQALQRCWGHTRTSAAVQQLTQALFFVLFGFFFLVFFSAGSLTNGHVRGSFPTAPPSPPAAPTSAPLTRRCRGGGGVGGGSGGRGPLGARGRHVSARPDLLWANGGARRAWNRRNGRAPPRPLPRASPQLTSRGPGP